jgi:protoporphyrinogen oxidase
MEQRQTVILGAGMTGLAAGLTSGLPVYEKTDVPGGICASYYILPGQMKRLHSAPDGRGYRFEIGGGHWLWGGDPLVLRFMRSITSLKSYSRRAAVYLPDEDLFVPYPIQNHLCALGRGIAAQALDEMAATRVTESSCTTMAEWLRMHFGPTLCRIFFDPFHELYTAGLWRTIAPQDGSKSPVNLSLVRQGTFNKTPRSSGYNTSFSYPVGGLNVLAQGMATRCNIQYGRRVLEIDPKGRTVCFDNGATLPYELIVSTLPLDRMCKMVGLTTNSDPDPFTSVMVINIGARKGARCPREHWLYIPKSKAGFHRVGFYSNVDSSFLPTSGREKDRRVSIYVEKAYPGGQKPGATETESLCRAVIEELQAWGWIDDIEVVDPTWIDTAYTWVKPGSRWQQEAVRALEAYDIYQVGRYGRWAFQVTDQGISQSIRDGLMAGGSLKSCA